MFVFPAFDSNYKTRKRTFKCCRTCRARRLKCIQSNDYETEGCDICDKDGYVCDLIKKDVSNPVVAGGESGGKGLLLSTQDSERVPDHHSPLPSGGGGRSLNGHIRPNEYGIGYPATSHNYYTLPPPDSIRLSSIANQGNQSNSQPYLESAPLPSAYLYDTRTYQSDRISNEFRHHQPQQYTQHQHQHQRHHRYIQPRMNQYLKQPSLAIPDYKNFRLQLPDQIPPSKTKHMPTEARTTTDPPIPSVNQAFTTKFLKWTFNFNTNKNFYIDSFESNSLDEFRTFKNDADQLEIQNKQVLLLLISIDAFRIGFDLKTTKELLELYFFKVNSIFPIIEEHTFWSDYERGIFPNVILYGMILAVSTDKLAEEIFIANCVLERNDTTNTKILELCSKLDLKTRTLLTVLPDLGDDNTFARFLTYLLLLMNTGYNVFGIEKSQSDLAEAIRLSKALEINEKDGSISKGLFISNSTNKKFCKSTYSQNLWWTCYVFDKLNSFIHCKPTLIHNGDFNLDRPMYGFLLMLIDDCDKIEISSLSTLSELENFVKDEFSKNVNDFDRFSCFKEDSIDLVPSELYLPNVLLSTYKKNMSYFFKRMLKLIQITSVHKSFSNEIEVTGFSNNINNIVASSVSNLLRYVKHINTKEIISIHWVPGALCFGLLTMLNISDIARKTKTDDSILVSYYICIKDVTKELKTRFDSKWWFAKETISISNVLVQLLYGSNNNIRAAKSNEINFNNLIVLTNSTSNSGTPGPSETQSILSSTPTSNYDDLQPSDDSIKRTGLGMDNPMQKVKIASLLSTDDIVENKNNFTRGDSNERVNICEKRSN